MPTDVCTVLITSVTTAHYTSLMWFIHYQKFMLSLLHTFCSHPRQCKGKGSKGWGAERDDRDGVQNLEEEDREFEHAATGKGKPVDGLREGSEM